MYGERMVIHVVKTKKIPGHPGMNRMKALMWSYAYWPSMDKDIENMVKSCKSYASVVKAPLLKFNPWPKTDKPWSRLYIDYAGPIKEHFCVIVDSFKK